MAENIEIKAQVGPQWDFMATKADIAVYGGARGGGKTWAALAEPIRHLGHSRFGAVIFRREYPEIRNEGGLWDKSLDLYPSFGGVPREGYLDWHFPSGAKIRFAHLQRKDDTLAWRGAEIPLIIFDQLETFTWEQFWYMLSCNRSTCGVIPYVRATCNPDPDHPLRKFLIDGGYIDPVTGYAIAEASGRLRWFCRVGNDIHWGDSKEELVARHGSDVAPKSFTFIRSSVYDNKILLSKDPGYIANLKSLSKIERERYLGDIEKGGNWNVRDAAGEFFRRAWFEIVAAAPGGGRDIRYWDRAATDETSPNAASASWTAGIRLRKMPNGVFYVCHVDRFQGSPGKVQERVKNVASQDGKTVSVGIEGDPGQAGRAEAQLQIRNLAGYNVRANFVGDPKGVRAKPVSAQAEAGNIKIVRGDWNEDLLKELENFDGSKTCRSDQVDALSGAFMMLTSKKEVQAG